MTTDLISISQAANMGIDRLRKPIWLGHFDHVKIDLINGSVGPWFLLKEAKEIK